MANNGVDLSTLASVKQYLGIPGTESDAILSALITSASQFAASYCSRNFYITSYTEVRNGTGGTAMSPRNRPVTAVASVSVNGYPVIGFQGWPNGTPGFSFDDNVIYYVNGNFPQAQQNVTLVYTAGLVAYVGSPPQLIVPADLQQAINEMVGIKFKRRTNLAVRSETLATQTITYELSELSPGVMRVLGTYDTVTPL